MAATVATVDQLQTQTRARLQYVLKKRKVSICIMEVSLCDQPSVYFRAEISQFPS